MPGLTPEQEAKLNEIDAGEGKKLTPSQKAVMLKFGRKLQGEGFERFDPNDPSIPMPQHTNPDDKSIPMPKKDLSQGGDWPLPGPRPDVGSSKPLMSDEQQLQERMSRYQAMSPASQGKPREITQEEMDEKAANLAEIMRSKKGK